MAIIFSSCNKDRDIAIDFSQLPFTAQEFVRKYFPASANPAFNNPIVTKDTEWFDEDPYTVMFTTGDKVTFRSNGEWKEFDGRTVLVPEEIIHSNIRAWVAQNYPGEKVIKIDRGNHDIEIKLSNMVEAKFDLNGNIIKIEIDD